MRGFEADHDKLLISNNTLAASADTLTFSDEWPEDSRIFNTFIITKIPPHEIEERLKKMVMATAKKVIILDPDYSYRWVIDLNFEIKYRQNDVVLLQKVD